MTKTAKTETGTLIGICVTCKTRYFAATKSEAVYCDCRSAQGYPRTFVKYGVVLAAKSTRKCTDSCTSAKSLLCSCECAGINHGVGHKAV